YARANKKTAEAGDLTLKAGGQVVARRHFEANAAGALVLEVPEAEKHLPPGKETEVEVGITGKNHFPYTLSWPYHTTTPASAEQCAVALTTRLDRATANEGDTVRLTAIVANKSGKGQGMTVAILGLPAGLTIPEDMKQLKDHARLRNNGTEPGLISAF